MFYYRDTKLYAVRRGPFKAHFITRSAYGMDKPVEHETPPLYHLGHDPSEHFDVAKDHPDVIADVRRIVATTARRSSRWSGSSTRCCRRSDTATKPSYPGSAWERTACEALPRGRYGRAECEASRCCCARRGRASKTVRSQAEPGNEEVGAVL